MLDPLSLTAVTVVLGAVATGTANEAGKWVWESAGGLVRRIAGREVPAPATGPDLNAVARMVHDSVRGDPELARAWTRFARTVPMSDGAALARPRLPASIRFFHDRAAALKALDREAARRPDGRPRIALLHGPEGMGTSTLAVHWGGRAAGRFPDGQLYADLRGTSEGGGLDPAPVLASLLRQLGLPDTEIPPAAAARAERLREYVADRTLLLVLDHAQSAAQIRPLLTSAPGVFTLVVARHPLPGLDALAVPVGPLPEKDAVRLLTDLAGKPAVAAARAALPQVLQRCGGSPFALRAAAPQLAVFDGSRRPEEEPAVPPASDPLTTAAETAYRRLAPDAARLYRQLGLYDWPALGPAAAAHTAELGEREAARLLAELARFQLLEQRDDGRYRFRPAVRRHAERAAHEDGIPACAAALARTVQSHLHLALAAAAAALPESWRVPARPEGVPVAAYADRGAALAALVTERDNLVQAVRAAAEFADHDTVVLLCRALWPLQLKAGHHDTLLPALHLGVQTADTHMAGTRTAGALHAQLALSLMELTRFDEAEPHARAAVRDERAAGHTRGEASAIEFLGLLRLRQWRYQEAYDRFEEAAAVLGRIGPGDEGAADVPRATALLERHRGRALRGLGRRAEATERLETALRFFRETGDTYNAARSLTDLAETHLDDGAPAAALPLVEEAETVLRGQEAAYHLAHLRGLRERCVTA